MGQVFVPDFMLLRRTAQSYKHRYPQPADVLLVIEAAESSLRRDREEVLVHRDPQGEAYRTVKTLSGEEPLRPLAAPEFSVTVQQLFA